MSVLSPQDKTFQETLWFLGINWGVGVGLDIVQTFLLPFPYGTPMTIGAALGVLIAIASHA